MRRDPSAPLRDHWHAGDECPSLDGEVGRATPAFMVCPSAPGIPKAHSSLITAYDRLAKGNYAACLGSEHYQTAIEGTRSIPHDKDDAFEVGIMSVIVIPNYSELVEKTKAGKTHGEWKFAHQWGTKASKIKDPLTRTILISEVMPWDGHEATSPDIRGVWTSASMGASTYTHKYGPNSPMPDRINGCDRTIPSKNPLFCERVTASGPDSSVTWASARSAHPNGVVGAMGDGSVRFFTDDIHLPLWQAYATRSGLEP